MTTLLGDSWYDLVDKEMLWLYRCDGVRFNFSERVHQRNLDAAIDGNYSEFSYKAGSTPLLKGFDQQGYLILIARRALEENELFDLSIRLA